MLFLKNRYFSIIYALQFIACCFVLIPEAEYCFSCTKWNIIDKKEIIAFNSKKEQRLIYYIKIIKAW